MQLKNLYEWNFRNIVSAFLKKYNEKPTFGRVTICHVEQIDEDSFAFVRRMERPMLQTLYERIVVDRKGKTLKGYTFETPQSEVYSENYVYTAKGDNKTQYEMNLWQSPGLQRLIRGQLHQWGVSKLTKLMQAEQNELQQRITLNQKLRDKRE